MNYNGESIKKLLIYRLYDGTTKYRVFYENGEEEISKTDADKIIDNYASMNKNESKQEFVKNLKDNNSFFVAGCAVKYVYDEKESKVKKVWISEDEYLDSIRKDVFKELNTEKINGYNVNVNRVAFPINGNAEIPDEDFKEFDEKEEKKDGKIKTFFKNISKKVKDSRLGVKVTAVAIAGAMLFGLYSCAHKRSMDGQIANNNIEYSQTETVKDNDKPVEETAKEDSKKAETAYQKLLAQATSLRQREVMQMMSDNLDYYNIEFANAHKEAGKDIKATITWDEMMALQVAVNDYTDEELREIFPQLKVNANFVGNTMRNYNKANKQLMMSYIIETKESRVNAYKLVESSEGKEFVKKYEDMYFAAHEATGSDKLEKVKK